MGPTFHAPPWKKRPPKSAVADAPRLVPACRCARPCRRTSACVASSGHLNPNTPAVRVLPPPGTTAYSLYRSPACSSSRLRALAQNCPITSISSRYADTAARTFAAASPRSSSIPWRPHGPMMIPGSSPSGRSGMPAGAPRPGRCGEGQHPDPRQALSGPPL